MQDTNNRAALTVPVAGDQALDAGAGHIRGAATVAR